MRPRDLSRPLYGLMTVAILFAVAVQAQTPSYERAFPQQKATIEKALKTMQGSLSGRLPVLEGFAQGGEHPLDRYRRGYYQTTVEVSSSPSGGSVVRVTAKVTAWYSDPAASHSGYELLISNGRLEADVLDQLGEHLAMTTPANGDEALATGAPSREPAASSTKAAESVIAAPAPRFPDTSQTFSSSLSHGLSAAPGSDRKTVDQAAEKTDNSLQSEADSLEKILKAMAHPNDLVAVRKSGTPVVSTPSLTAKPQFLASMHDEFELLDFNADWVHVRISGLSRGWIWRNSVEMPQGIPDTTERPSADLTSAADLFHVTREQVAPFPGDWEPLRNKRVKIVSVQKVDDGTKDAGPKERLEYAKFLLEKSYADISQNPQELQGVVVIFDSADGGMIAATAATLRQWKAGGLTDSALWHKCFFDPPETFDSAAASGSK